MIQLLVITLDFGLSSFVYFSLFLVKVSLPPMCLQVHQYFSFLHPRDLGKAEPE